MAENVMFNDKMFENSKYCKPFLQRFSLEFPHHGISSQHLMYVVILICTKNFGQNKISLRFKVDFHCGELRNIRIFFMLAWYVKQNIIALFPWLPVAILSKPGQGVQGKRVGLSARCDVYSFLDVSIKNIEQPYWLTLSGLSLYLPVSRPTLHFPSSHSARWHSAGVDVRQNLAIRPQSCEVYDQFLLLYLAKQRRRELS